MFLPSYVPTISFLLYRPNTPGRLSKVSQEAKVFYKKYMDLLGKLILPAGYKGVSMNGWYDYTWSTVPTKDATFNVQKVAVYDVCCSFFFLVLSMFIFICFRDSYRRLL